MPIRTAVCTATRGRLLRGSRACPDRNRLAKGDLNRGARIEADVGSTRQNTDERASGYARHTADSDAANVGTGRGAR